MNVQILDDVIFRDLAGETVLLSLASGTYFGLNAVGSRMWQLLSDKCAFEDIVRTLLGEFDVDEIRLRQDLAALVQQLAAKGLVSADG